MSILKKAMEKAKAERGKYGPGLFRDDPKKSLRVSDGEVNPNYSVTKTIPVDPDILRRNKVISLFHEESVTDQMKILRTQILGAMEQIGGNSLLVTSARPGEGKTLTAINLAISISYEVDHTVLLVDANLRSPCVNAYLGLNVEKGLSDFLLQNGEIPDLLINPGIERLVILPGGRALPNSSELLGGPRMEALVAEMKKRYPDRFIVFDSSSLLMSADPLVCAGFTDGILLVVEAEKTPVNDVEKATGLLKDKKLIGTLLNKAR
jgi:non-specific protein-tyrosine kinase